MSARRVTSRDARNGQPSPSRALLGAVLLLLVPIGWALAIPFIAARTTIASASPFIGKFGNDEVDYWLQINAFVHAGLSAGQFGWEERVAPAAFTHFGPHGPIYHAMMGSVGRVIGWEYATPIYINVALVLMGMLVLAWTARPTLRQACVLAALLVGYWPAWDNLITAMQEPLHVAIGLAAGGLYVQMLRDPTRRRPLVALLALLSVGATMRVTWALVMIPVIVVAMRSSSRARWARAASLLVPVPFAVLYGQLASPYPYNPTSVAAAAGGRRAQLDAIWANMRENVQSFSPGPSTYGIDLVFRYEVLALVVLVQVVVSMWLVRGAIERRRESSMAVAQPSSDREVILVAWWAVTVLFVMTLVLYQFASMRGYRVLGPHVLVVLIVAALHGRSLATRTALVATVVVGIATLPLGIHHYTDFGGPRFDGAPAAVRALRTDLRAVRYQRDTGSRWCNTILWRSRIDQFPEAFAGLPPGIGVTVDRYYSLEQPYRSRWVVSDPVLVAQSAHPEHLRHIGQTAYGALYENTRASCPRPARA